MNSGNGESGGFKGTLSRRDYQEMLKAFDAAVCEAMAVGQATAMRLASPGVGYSTHVFARMCAHARSLICATPLSRWVRVDFETWDVSSVAAHARSILEGYLLFFYLSNAPDNADTQRAYVTVMHLYDCLKRIKILPTVLPKEEISFFVEQAAELKGRLEQTKFFSSLPQKAKKDILAGKYMMITPQVEVIASSGIEQKTYDFFWNYLSQYTHILSFTFYRIEPNGRGTGKENGFDRDALCMVLDFCTTLMNNATDRMVDVFPDAAEVRLGVDSKFSPGPARNLPRHMKRGNGRKGGR